MKIFNAYSKDKNSIIKLQKEYIISQIKWIIYFLNMKIKKSIFTENFIY